MGCGISWGIFLIVIGLWIWASNHDIVVFKFSRDWPVLLVVLGIYLIVMIRRRRLRIRLNSDKREGQP